MEYGEIIAAGLRHVKENGTMLLIAAVLCATGVVQQWFQFNLTLTIGLGLAMIYTPLVIRDRYRKKKAAPTYDTGKYAETVRSAQEALDRITLKK
jgi:hypothetical protein